MTPPDPRIEAIFHEALARTPAERDTFVAEACAGDETLPQEVQRLLTAHEEAGAYFEPPNSPEIEAELARLKPEEAGELIGPYKLLEQIGEGGFGTVWIAEQKVPVRRRVALKILKLGMDTKDVLARFEQERQALALMDHPSIAKVFDAGATQYGRPFIVMELVAGVKITEFCDAQNLAMRARLELFMAVCHAVQHAHQKGVIHRDLKPSNVLVMLQDGAPVPKIIDFGVAKAVQQRLSDLTVYTQFEQMIGTPPYMSPEQAEANGLNVDTRTDIYALGILLYELLTGKPPFDAQTLASAGYEEIRRIIREVEPPKPSSRLSTVTGQERTALARTHQVDPDKLSRMVEPDLDWVVMKALEKDRTRRYETANGLATDIQHYLNSEPVLAGPPSTLYRARKYIRKHQKAVTIAVAVNIGVLLLACAGLVLMESLRFRGAMKRDLATLASVLGQNTTRAIQFQNRDDARETLEGFRMHRHIVAAGMYQVDGTLFAQFLRDNEESELPETVGNAGEARFERDRLVVSQPILFEGRRIGTLHLRSDLDELYRGLQMYAGILLVVWITSVACALLIGLVLASRLQARR